MVQHVTHIGELGTPGRLVRPLIFPVERTSGQPWDLTGYDQPELQIWDVLTRTLQTITGTVTIAQDNGAGAITGEPNRWYIRFDPAAGDLPNSGQYEARLYMRPGTGAKEPSGFFRFSIAAAANP